MIFTVITDSSMSVVLHKVKAGCDLTKGKETTNHLLFRGELKYYDKTQN